MSAIKAHVLFRILPQERIFFTRRRAGFRVQYRSPDEGHWISGPVFERLDDAVQYVSEIKKANETIIEG